MEYYTLMSILENDLSLKDLRRIVNSNIEYLVLDVSVFNVGAVVRPILTNNYNKYEHISNDGYSCILPLDYELINTIKEVICKLFKELERVENWQRDESFESFLKREWKITFAMFKNIRALYNANHNIY